MKRIFIFFLLSQISYYSFSQEFKIINFDFTNFPEMSLLYEATDESGKVITDAKLSDFKIEENNKTYIPSKIKNPDGGLAPVSMALVVDNSGSMSDDGRLTITKKGINIFLKSFPFETSEMALESFSDDVIVNTDFTQKPERVAFTLNSISPLTGTNFNNAFLKTYEGAIELMQKSLNKKLLVLITDGLSSANVKDIADKAISSGIEVYSIIIQLNSPKDLRNISKMTGGYVIENIIDEVRLASCLSAILQKSQISRYGTLKWKTENNCNADRHLKISFKNIPVATSYIVPSDKIANLEVNPATIYFETSKADSINTATVELVPRRSTFNVTNLSLTKPEIFSILPNTIIDKPLLPDSTFKFNVNCTLNDDVQSSDFIRISTKECPDKTIKLVVGSEENLMIIHPSGGEVFVPGMDTIIKWDGISGKRKVDISFRTSSKKEWKTFDIGSKWLYNWSIPNDTCTKCQVKLTPRTTDLFELKPVKAFEFQGNVIKSITFNNNSKYLVSSDDGYVVVWNTLTGLKERVYGGFKYENADFYDENNTLVLFNKDKITLLKDDNKAPSNYNFKDKKVFTSMCFDNGNEELISAYLLKDNAGCQRIWMPGTNNVFFIGDKHNSTSGSFSSSDKYLITIENNSKLFSWETKTKNIVTSFNLPKWFTKAVIGSSDLMAVIGINNISIVSLPNFSVLWTRNDLNYLKFSKSGNEIIAADTSGKYCYIDCSNGNTLFSFHDYNLYQCSPVNRQIIHYSNDTLVLYDANKRKNIVKFVDPDLRDCRFSPDGLKLLVVSGRNEIDIYNADNGQLQESVSDIATTANLAVFSPDNKKVAVTLSNGIIQLFEKVNVHNLKEAVSNTFSIVKPKLKIEDTINFGDRYVNQQHELMVKSYAKNNSRFPVKLTGIEIFNDNKKVFTNLLTQFPIILDSMKSLDCEFKFSPTEIGIHEAYLKTYTSTDTFITIIKGNGVHNPVTIDAFEINFGKVRVNSFKDTLAKVLYNRGSDTIISEEIANAGPDTLQFTLLPFAKNIKTAPDNYLNCKIQFAPKYRGLTTGYLNIYIKGKKDPQRIRLTGNGLAPRMVTVKGTVRNILDSLPLVADLTCNDLISNKTITTEHTNTTGQFSVNLNADRNYSLVASKAKFISSSENIDLSELTSSDTIYKDLWLTEIKSGGIIKLNCIFFDFAKSTLKDISINDLNRIVKMLSENKSINIEIHGHTDNIGSDSANMVLSSERAKAVKNYIIKKGIPISRLKTIPFGEKVPVADNNTEEGRKSNRRVEFKIVEGIGKR